MPATSPTIVIREIDLSEYIPAASGARFGIVGVAKKGPVNTPTTITSESELLATFGTPYTNHYGIHAALQFLRRGSQVRYIRITDGSQATAFKNITDGSVTTLTATALSPGTEGNRISVVIGTASNGVSAQFNLTVFLDDILVEDYPNCKQGLASQSDIRYVQTLINGISSYITITDVTPSTSGRPTNGTYDLAGGSDGVASLTSAHYIGVSTPSPTGLQLFRDIDAEDIDILAVPGVTLSAVYAEILDICEERADCIGIVDPPDNLSVAQVIDWHNAASGSGNTTTLNTSYATTAWPWVKVFDTFNQVELFVPPSGSLAAAMALTDSVAAPWFAPAGFSRGRFIDALDVRTKTTKSQRDLLYLGGNVINPIISVMAEGIFLLGQRTLQRNPTALDRINVRRGLLLIEKTVTQLLRPLLFEPNDAQTWSRLKMLVNPFLEDVKNRRGLERYRVICDETTNPPAQRSQGILRAQIMLVFVQTAEVIQLDFVLKPAGATFNESVIT